MLKCIAIEEAIKEDNALFVDVRSPEEYAIDAIPSAINVPLLDNEQRAKVGKVYQSIGPKEARFLGMELISPNLPQKINSIRKLADNKNIIIYCWRGGLRSKAMCELLNLAGISTLFLTGGYKSYRGFINNYFNEAINYRFIVLYGLTGVGKTEILNKLSDKKIPILNLEKLASHRGSVFGNTGLPQQPSQKKFESNLHRCLSQYKKGQLLVVEGESRRIGRVVIPEQLFAAMQKGSKVLVYDLISNRISRIIDEYVNGFDNNLQELADAINSLQARIGKSKTEKLTGLLQANNFEEIIRELLVNYYDILYHHPNRPDEKYDLCLNTKNIDEAIQKLIEYFYCIA